MKPHQDGLCQVVTVDTGRQERLDDLLVQVCAQRCEAIELHLHTSMSVRTNDAVEICLAASAEETAK